jgi:HSP20 family molecular chaperone IbpA
MQRSMTYLPDADEDKVDAEFENGVLESHHKEPRAA